MQAPRVNLDHRVSLDPRVSLEIMALQGRSEVPGAEGRMDCLVRMEHPAGLVLLDLLASLETEVAKDLLDRKVLVDLPDLKVCSMLLLSFLLLE